MTYRELLNLYKQGKLDDVRKKEVEAAIEKQEDRKSTRLNSSHRL